jgi:hypothetical protein
MTLARDEWLSDNKLRYVVVVFQWIVTVTVIVIIVIISISIILFLSKDNRYLRLQHELSCSIGWFLIMSFVFSRAFTCPKFKSLRPTTNTIPTTQCIKRSFPNASMTTP